MMRRNKNLTQAIVLGLLLTTPCVVLAGEIGLEAKKDEVKTNTDPYISYEGSSKGVYANGGTIELGNKDSKFVTVNAENREGITHAVEANAGTINIQGNSIVIDSLGKAGPSGDANRAVSLSNSSTLLLGSSTTENILLSTEGQGRNRSLDVKNSCADIFGKTITITAAGDTDNRALNIYEGAKLTMGDSSTEEINLKAELKGEQQSTLGKTFTHTAVLIYKDTEVQLTGKKVYIDASGNLAKGIDVADNSSLVINSDETYINVEGNGENVGVKATSSSNINLQGKLINVNISGKDSHIKALSAEDNAKLTIGNSTSKIMLNVNADKKSTGIYAHDGSVDITADSLRIDATGEESHAVYAYNAKSDTSVNITANTIVLNSEYEGLKISGSKTSANINGNLIINASDVITTYNNASININDKGSSVTNLNGDIKFVAENYIKADSNVNIVLDGENSSWKGNSKVVWEWGLHFDKNNADVNGLAISLKNGAVWTPTKVSEEGDITQVGSGTKYVALNHLYFEDGVISLVNEELNGAPTTTIEKLTGTGGTVTTDSVDNKLVIESKGQDTSITVKGVGSDLNADAIANDKTGELANGIIGTVVDGKDGVVADIVKAEEGIIYGEYTADVVNGKAENGTFAVNTSNEAISSMASIGLMAWRAENNDMNKRLGELRNSQGEHGIWTRMVRGESEYGDQGIKNQYNTYQLGYDEKLSVDKRWTVGAALSYTDGKSSLGIGSGENKHTGFALYGSYLGDDGSFVDLIAKYARLDHDFDFIGGIGNSDYETNGYSVSAEYGKRFSQNNGFWLEPQVELTYGHVNGVSYLSSNGAAVQQDSMNSFVGRVGITAGKDIKDGNVYVRASYLYDFDGETKLTMTKGNSVSFEQDLGGGWFEVGIGTNINLSDATYVSIDVESTFCGDVETPWQWNAGVRYSF